MDLISITSPLMDSSTLKMSSAASLVLAQDSPESKAVASPSFLAETIVKPLSDPTTTTPTTKYATVNYGDGLIGINATDPYAFSTETRSFNLPVEIQILMCLFYGTLAFTAITSNMIVCYIVLSSQKMRTATNYFIVNLAVGDILMALLCIPFTFPANLIFQYWPFGLSLCVVVSYSAATSVIISAYTMVAISIDKYLAIMYPMRLRMPKVQAKIIILAIWSAALITSLPTALLSRLSPAYLETTSSAPSSSASSPSTSSPSSSTSSSTVAVTSSSQATAPSAILSTVTGSSSTFTSELLSGLEANVSTWSSQLSPTTITNSSSQTTTISLSSMTSLPASSHNANEANLNASQQHLQHNHDTVEQYNSEHNKQYFCQESWTFWPKGKYYYSMALMLLQFVVPLFVLVITYTRIVIVVWGKRMPGEEDDARDARMARSKRKMIKMVIFCVIAFALTWLPFNALIVIGDLKPDIWEHQNIMYIWFITHYLAMCHTITNPLIYIWMNNRFRAGFKQVIGDLCRVLHRLIVYLYCYLCCFACVVRSSRVKYTSSIARMKEKAGTPSRYMTSSGSANFNMNNYNLKLNNTQSHTHNVCSPMRRTTSGGQTYFLASSSLDSDLAMSRCRPASVEPTTCIRSITPRPAEQRGRLLSSSMDVESPLDSQAGVVRAARKQQAVISRPGMTSRNAIDPICEQAKQHQQAHQQASSSSAIKRIRIFKCSTGERKRRHFRPSSSMVEAKASPVNEPGATGLKSLSTLKRYRKKEKQSHVISIQMTSIEYHQARTPMTKVSHTEKALVEATSTSGAAIGVPPLANAIRQHFRKKSKGNKAGHCPACRLRSTDRISPGKPMKLRRDIQVDTRRSSQSTATLSIQTNTTLLPISPSKSSSATNVAQNCLDKTNRCSISSCTDSPKLTYKSTINCQTSSQLEKDGSRAYSELVYMDDDDSPTSCLSSLDGPACVSRGKKLSNWSIPSNYGASSNRITIVPTNSDKPISYCLYHRHSTSCTVDLTEDDILDVFQPDQTATCDGTQKLIRRENGGSLESLSDQFDQETGDESAIVTDSPDQIERLSREMEVCEGAISKSGNPESISRYPRRRSVSLASAPARAIAPRSSQLTQSESCANPRGRSLRRTMLLNNHLATNEEARISAIDSRPSLRVARVSLEQVTSANEQPGQGKRLLCKPLGDYHILHLDAELGEALPRPVSNPSSLAKNQRKQSSRDELAPVSSWLSPYRQSCGIVENPADNSGKQVVPGVGDKKEQPDYGSASREPDQTRLAIKQESLLLMSHQAAATNQSYPRLDLPEEVALITSSGAASELSCSPESQAGYTKTKSGGLKQTANAVRKSPTVYLINKSPQTG